MNYRRGMDLEAWVAAHAGLDVIAHLASAAYEMNEQGEWVAEPPDFDRLDEETGRLIGIVDGMLYLDSPAGPSSMPVPQVMEAIRKPVDGTGRTFILSVIASESGVAAPRPFDPAHIAEIEGDHDGIGRQRWAARLAEFEEEERFIKDLVATTPCCLCGRLVQTSDGGYDVLAPDSGLGDEGDARYVPIDPTWRVVCRRHESAESANQHW